MKRRDLLKAGVLGSLWAPLPFARVWAQSESRDGALRLLTAPKLALVLGNSGYKDVPALKNPANDARDMGAALKAAGFDVVTRLDAGREAMVAAIGDYVREMERRKAVGLFYFAGHGVQLDWRNYMLPVDAVIDRIEDIPKQCVDIAQLIEGLTRASNPMNVIILDACRENPFGKAKVPAQKGLSQMDAPMNTILAYATSPGNVASDGEGSNGLYTEHLLREMKVAEAKIEDVFKRVRLGVRRKTSGSQIPWESTSLEEDFWFLPPRELKALSDAEKERQFNEELAAWEKAAGSRTPAPLEDYLRRWPSGRFSELAQLELDRLLAAQGEKRIELASAEGNPFTKGSARPDLGYQVGDSYRYREFELESRQFKRTYSTTIVGLRGDEVVFDTGLILDLLGNLIRSADGRRYTPRQDQPLDYAVGRRWSTRFRVSNEKTGVGASVEFDFQITGRERITVPAGSFDCFVIEGLAPGVNDNGARIETRQKRWIAPERVRRPIAQETLRRVWLPPKPPARQPSFPGMAKPPPASGAPVERVQEALRIELESYRQG